MKDLPNQIFSGYYKEGHVQGIAVDPKRGYVYYSFTTLFLKTDLYGNVLGSVVNLAGHLGCITFNPDDGRVYGSLELKHDAIGKAISERTGYILSDEDAFYLVGFDVDAIDRMNIDAEKEKVMTAMYLPEVVRDFNATDEVSGASHRYGCSGIDGTGYGPVFGSAPDSPKKFMIAYGIYGDVFRDDNDCQVILQYDPSDFTKYAQPLNQANPHHSGPEACENKYFFHTGNTTWGVQNLEYDPKTGNWVVAVYCGKKEQYTNFKSFFIDGKVPAVRGVLPGRNTETGLLLRGARIGKEGLHGIFGIDFPYGQTGISALGDGTYYISIPGDKRDEKGHFYCSSIHKYIFNPNNSEAFEDCSEIES